MARNKGFDEDYVIEQSLEIFRRQGYEATSIRDLVARLGVSSSSLYSTFGDKETLFMRALERHSHQERAMIRQRLAHPDHPQATIEHLFCDWIDQLMRDELPAGSLTLRAAVELGLNKPAIAEFLSSYLDELVQIWADFLAESVCRGRLVLTDPAPDVARYLLLALYNLSFLAQMYQDRAYLENYARVVMRVLGEAGGPPVAAAAAMPLTS